MRQGDRICHRVLVKSLKERELYLKRQENYIENTPKIIVGKMEASIQEIWTDVLHSEPVARLKELNSNERAYNYARKIIVACTKLAPRYGYFIINENMIFFNLQKEIFAWINPDILENNVKIYLPNSQEGQLAMIRSIVTFVKVWLRCDCLFLSEAKHLDQLVLKFDILRGKINEGLRNRSPGKDFLANRKTVGNYPSVQHTTIRFSNGLKAPPDTSILAIENRSNRDFCLTKSSAKQEVLVKSLSNKQKYLVKQVYHNSSEKEEKEQAKNKTTLSRNTDQISDKNAESIEHEYEHKTFNNTNTNQSAKLSMNQSVGLKTGNNYFPNRTTSNKNHPIVQLINSQNDGSQEFKQNKILIADENEAERDKIKKMKESLDGIGEEVNELFFSNIDSDENKDNKDEEKRKIEQQFGNLLS